jgi:hypothetical protein
VKPGAPADQRDQQDEQIERDPQAGRVDAGQQIERVKLHRQVGQEEDAEHRQKQQMAARRRLQGGRDRERRQDGEVDDWTAPPAEIAKRLASQIGASVARAPPRPGGSPLELGVAVSRRPASTAVQ